MEASLVTNSPLPAVTPHQMRQVDDLAEGRYQLHLMQMMENAGRGLAGLTRDSTLGGSAAGKSVLVLVGRGGNGGGGLATARRLMAWGAQIHLILAQAEEELGPVPRRQLEILKAAGVEPVPIRTPWPHSDVILDALLGYSARGAPRPPMDDLARKANSAGPPVLALDIPTGLDPESGQPSETTIKAKATLTLALPKTGLLAEAAADYVGELWLADLGIPLQLYADLDLRVPNTLFARDDLVRLR